MVWLSVAVIIHSMAFWLGGRLLIQQIQDSFLMAASFPAHALPLWLKAVLLTVFPAGFITLVPVDMVREFSWWKAAAMILAVVILGFLAVRVFYRGLKQYTSGSQLTEVR